MKPVEAVVRGAGAGLVACVVQVLVGKGADYAVLPEREDTHIAPRFVRRMAEDLGEPVSETTQWVLGTAFHLGYAVFWGGAYGFAYRKRPVEPVVGGTLLGGLIYALAFSRWGVAVQTGTERPPERRTKRMTAVAATVALTYGLTTALLFGRPEPDSN